MSYAAKRKARRTYQIPLRLGRRKKSKGRKKERKSRAGPNFYHGDDLRLTKQDRKRRGRKYEPWERR